MAKNAKTFNTKGSFAWRGDKKAKPGGVLHTGEVTREFGEEYEGGDAWAGSGTSIFDPVLCELAYRWFSPPGGVVLDPFAGGSVRGIVASKLGRPYYGVDLSTRQITANKAQGAVICANDPHPPTWINGNSLNIETLATGVEADFIFSCPPYFDLEIYSEAEDDLSAMSYEQFREVYANIIAAAVRMLKPDRFACFVVGDVRDKNGIYRNFPAHTVQAFIDAGADYYNEAVLVTSVGSLPVRVGRQFKAGRKLGKTHQNVFTFVKGDPKRAASLIEDD
jgi:DNA modification methylase